MISFQSQKYSRWGQAADSVNTCMVDERDFTTDLCLLTRSIAASPEGHHGAYMSIIQIPEEVSLSKFSSVSIITSPAFAAGLLLLDLPSNTARSSVSSKRLNVVFIGTVAWHTRYDCIVQGPACRLHRSTDQHLALC